MKLQLLVCQYSEDESIIEPLLQSIALQRSVDFKNDIEVIICNDGSDVLLSESFLKQFPYTIHYYMEPHRGLYATRNACMDYATADYVMFCDADDMFYNALGIKTIISETKKQFDILNSAFIEEVVLPTGETVYVEHENDVRFVHGKVYRREFLIENNLRYNGDLKVHGDSYFLNTAETVCKNACYIRQPFYLWVWRSDSICRKNKNHVLNTYVDLIDSQDAVIDNLLSRGCTQDAMKCASGMVYGTFYKINSPACKNKAELVGKIEKRIKTFLDKRKDLIKGIPDDLERQIIMSARNHAFSEGMMIERITLEDWLAHIKSL